MKKPRKPRLVVTTLPCTYPTNQRPGPDGDDPITTSGTICTLVVRS